MADLVERNAVLSEIGEFQIRFSETGDSHERVAYASAEHCKLVIMAAPSVNRWIPCSERLPENNQQCLIYRDITGTNLKMTTGVYHSDGRVFIGLRHGTVLKDAIAWMPLPEPPKGDER